MTHADCVGLDKAAEQLLFLDLFGTFCGNAKNYIRNKVLQQVKLIPPFVLKQKVEPKVQGRFNAQHSCKLITLLLNRPEQQSEIVKFKCNTLLRAMRSYWRRWFFR